MCFSFCITLGENLLIMWNKVILAMFFPADYELNYTNVTLRLWRC